MGIVCKLEKYIKVQLGRNKICHNFETNDTQKEQEKNNSATTTTKVNRK